MSTSPLSPSSPNNPTRQLLDELDTLMERMLSLPVDEHEGGEPLPPRSPLWREPAAPVLISIEPPPSLPNQVEMIQTAAPSSAMPPATAATATSPNPISPAPRWSPRGILESALNGRVPEIRTSLWMQPILWSNRVFDRSTLRLGSAGRWLRGENGRTLLGWTGLVLLVLALTCLVLDMIGWSW
jgi:hypothetical protein